jgi:hypothetical protein
MGRRKAEFAALAKWRTYAKKRKASGIKPIGAKEFVRREMYMFFGKG